MEKQSISQSACGRAWDDTNHFYHGMRFFWFVEVIFTALGGFLGFILTPYTVDKTMAYLYPLLGSVSGAVVGFAIIFLLFLFLAPYRQRNELRTKLLAIPGSTTSMLKHPHPPRTRDFL